VPSYPSGMTVSSRAVNLLAQALRRRRRELRTRWRRLDAGRQALLVIAHLRKNETYADLAMGFAIGVSTAYRYIREGVAVPGGDGARPWTRPSRWPPARRT
jgi:hypothetical protein